MKLKEIEKQYKESQKQWRDKIKQEPNKWKRFWKWIWYFFAFPWIWLWKNIRDWRTAIIFVIVFLLVSSEVWIPFLIGLFAWNNETFRIAMFSTASAGLVFWNVVPCTPFLLICVLLTIGIKASFDAIKNKIEKRKEQRNEKRKQTITQKQSTD